MNNFVLINLKLEDKRTIRVCHECGEQFRSPRKHAKYCSPRCRNEIHRKNNVNPFSKRSVTDKVDHSAIPIDPNFYGHGCVGISESHNPFDIYDLSDGMMQEDMFYINRQIWLATLDNAKRKRRNS